MSASPVKINHYPFSLIVSVVSIISFGMLAILSPDFGNGAGVWEKLVKPWQIKSLLGLVPNTSLSTREEVERLQYLLEECQRRCMTYDARLLRNRVVNAYAHLKRVGKMNDELHSAFVGVAGVLNLNEQILGWDRDGVPVHTEQCYECKLHPNVISIERHVGAYRYWKYNSTCRRKY